MAANATMLGFVPDPAGRGTIGILRSCLTTLGLCAWTSLHLDLPSKRVFEPVFDIISMSAQKHGLLVKIWWMLVMLLAPEYVLMLAVEDWCLAYQAMRHVNREGKLSGTDIWTMDDGFFSVMQGFAHNGKPVDAEVIVNLIQDKTIPPQPSRATEIRDKSKSDALGKTLTCAQALWLAVQCLARAIQHLPISTLEVGTVGYVFIAVAVNGLYWYKPKDVLTPLELISQEARRLSPDGEALDEPDDVPARDVPDEEVNHFLPVEAVPTRWQRWLAWLEMTEDRSAHLKSFTVLATCALYGGWHCLAWNFAFPSVAEKWLWRIASILTSLPMFVIVLTNFTPYLPGQIEALVDFILLAIALVLYIFSRGYILVEMFIGLRRLPAGVFDTVRWIAFIPHV